MNNKGYNAWGSIANHLPDWESHMNTCLSFWRAYWHKQSWLYLDIHLDALLPLSFSLHPYFSALSNYISQIGRENKTQKL